MSHIEMIIEERAAQIGKFMVGRLLPFRQKRMVGPFIYIDHMGPVELGPDADFDILPHPHIGLSTLTYLLEGSILHRDSLGNSLEILPGEVNFMTAGEGIVHSERTPDRLRGKPKSMHGLQIWIALPKHLETMAPSFFHVEAKDIPAWEQDGAHFRLIAGEAFGRQSPVPVHSRLYMLEIKATENLTIDTRGTFFGEAGIYILEGKFHTDGNAFGPKQLLVSTEPELCSLNLEAGTIVYVFGGEPFPEERMIDWNFVASDPELIDKAVSRWKARQFPEIPGEDGSFIPYFGRR